MKRSKLTTFTVFVLIITMIALILVSNTYAKYTTEVTGEATATVAKFDVGGVTSDSFNLFETIYEANATDTEENVADERIAPGTGGYFEVTLTNASEVDVEYILSIEETSNTAGVPIEYSTSGTDGTYVTADEIASEATGTLDMETGTDTVTIYWRWAFEGDDSDNYGTSGDGSQTDETDTKIGIDSASTAATVTVTTSVVFNQID